MIRLTKGVEPAVLVRNAAAWTRELLQKIAANEEPSAYLLGRYSHPEIKTGLLSETNGKCAYCESSFRHVTYGDVEHITPKSVEPARRFEWRNLTIACDVCNTKKGDSVGILDPYSCEPADFFYFLGPLMWATPTAPQAVLTEEKLELNRDGLVERRKERLDYLRSLVDSASSKPRDIRDAMIRRAEQEVENRKPFSACGRESLKRLKQAYGLA